MAGGKGNRKQENRTLKQGKRTGFAQTRALQTNAIAGAVFHVTLRAEFGLPLFPSK